jgi:hypothetical protein
MHETKVIHQAVQGWLNAYYFDALDYEARRFSMAIDTQLAANCDWDIPNAFICAFMDLIDLQSDGSGLRPNISRYLYAGRL